jgi:hypothetical protein
MRHQSRLRSVAAATILASSTLTALAAPTLAIDPATGFTGRWQSIDCASYEGAPPDCSIWGDGSLQTMTIGPGATPAATYQDAFASVCADNGSPSTRWVAAGSGEYEDIFLWLTFHKSGCGAFGMGGYGGVQLYHDPGSDTIWEDEDGDGYGWIWYRVP